MIVVVLRSLGARHFNFLAFQMLCRCDYRDHLPALSEAEGETPSQAREQRNYNNSPKKQQLENQYGYLLVAGKAL